MSKIPFKDFWFMRHGETSNNAANIVSGQSENPLTDLGRKQAYDSIKYFTKLDIKVIYTSPLLRALETSTILQKNIKETYNIDIPIIQDDRLKEIFRGPFEGMTREAVHKLKAQDPDIETKSGAESMEIFTERVSDALISILTNEESPCLIISHSRVYTAITKILETLRGPIENCEPYFFKSPSSDNEHWAMTLGDVAESEIC